MVGSTSTLRLRVASKRTDKIFRDGKGIIDMAGSKRRYITTFLMDDGTPIESYSRDYYVYAPVGMTVEAKVQITNVPTLNKTFYEVISVAHLRELKQIATNQVYSAKKAEPAKKAKKKTRSRKRV